MTVIRCAECETVAAPLDWRCTQCGGVLDFATLPAFDANAIVDDDFSVWRYAAMLPVEKRLSLGEGMTPLTPVTLDDGTTIHAKLDYLNPTGSYKDRGTVTLMNHMAAQGVTEVVEDSSGNAGASVAAYGHALGMIANIYVPAHGNPGKLALIEAVGGTLIKVEGAQHAKTDACQQAAAHTPYASHAWSPYFLLGQMTAAYEIWEQCGRSAPEAIATPVGHGSLFLGIARGFRQLQAAGLVETVPKMYAVQSEHCDPIIRGWESGAEVPPHIDASQTVADGIIVDVPVRGREILQQLRTTEGAAFRVSDDATRAAMTQLHQRGILAEPTSAVTIAALPQIRAHLGGTDKTLVCVFTGNALKYIGR